MNSPVSRHNTVGVVFITHNAKHHLPHCLPPVLNSPLKPKVLVVNSSSQDGTVELAEEYGVDVAVIPRREFNHGATRELARKMIGTEIVVMMTPDAYPESEEFLEPLVKPLQKGIAGVAYARQLPHLGADFFEAFPRYFNYPDADQLRGLDDVGKYGAFTFFCSDSCAAWLNSALDEVGGFCPVLTGEDTIAAAQLLLAGYKIAYAADSRVRHSHRYTLRQEFQRYFDTGYAREGRKRLFFQQGGDERHGAVFMKQMLRKLAREKPMLLPYAMLQAITKYTGYRLGRMGHHIPLPLVRRLSSQDYYWRSIW